MSQPNPNVEDSNNVDAVRSASDESAMDAMNEALAEDSESPLTNVDQLQATIVDLQSRLIRMQADTENFRRRIQREQDEARNVVAQRLRFTDEVPL